MAVSLKRKLYSRGGSFETTIPMQLLFSLDMNKKHNVIFEYDKQENTWRVSFEEIVEKKIRSKVGSNSGNKNGGRSR